MNEPPPVNEVRMEDFAPIADSFREALKSDGIAKLADVLIFKTGLRDAMLKATNPKMLDALFDLAILTIDRFGVVHSKAGAWAWATNLANSLETRPAYDLKPYAAKLREKYPKP
jgi:hypothetical protein